MRPTGGSSGRWLTRALACRVAGVVGLLVWVGLPGAVGGSGARAFASPGGAGGTVGMQSFSLEALVVPAVQPLDQGQQGVAARQARHSSSAAYVARLRSRTEFSQLGTARAAQVAREAFPEVVDRPAGGPPQLPAGTKLARYLGPTAAQLELPGGKHGVMESTGPMAKEASPGHFTPIDLGLKGDNGGYTSSSSNIAVQIPKRLTHGVWLPESGVSLTPVNAQGAQLQGAEGSVDGSTVLYANTQTDTDTLVKPTTSGFQIDPVLRSPDSPDELYFRVGMPAGASLLHEPGSKLVRVRDRKGTIAVVDTPSAQDAAGTSVPVSTVVQGDTLALGVAVAGKSNEYQYPIEIDPTVIDTRMKVEHNGEFTYQSHWKVDTSNGKEGPFHFSEPNYTGIADRHKLGEVLQNTSEVNGWICL